MKRQIDAQDQKIDALIKNRDALQYTIDLETGYIRALGHWLSKFCEIIELNFWRIILNRRCLMIYATVLRRLRNWPEIMTSLSMCMKPFHA